MPIRYVLPLSVGMFILGLLTGLFLANMDGPRPSKQVKQTKEFQDPEEHTMRPAPVFPVRMQAPNTEKPPIVRLDPEGSRIPLENKSEALDQPTRLYTPEQLGEMTTEKKWKAVGNVAVQAPSTEAITIQFRCWKMREKREILYPDEVRFSGVGVTADETQGFLRMEPKGLIVFDLYFKSADLLATKIKEECRLQVVWNRGGETQSLYLDEMSIDPGTGLYTISWEDFLRGSSPTFPQ